MPPEDIEIVRRMLEAYAQGGFTAVTEFTHPDFEMSFMAHHPLGGRTYGAGEAGEAMLEFVESFEDFDVEAEELIDAGDRVIVALRERGRARGSVELEQVFGMCGALTQTVALIGKHEAPSPREGALTWSFPRPVQL